MRNDYVLTSKSMGNALVEASLHYNKCNIKGYKNIKFLLCLALGALLLSFGCKQAEHIYTAKWKDSIQINIVEGDERLGVICHGDFPFRTEMTWADIKEKMAQNVYLKGEWQGGDYELYDWRCENEDGEEITDEKIIVEDGMKVYPRSNYAKFKWEEDEPTSLAGCTGGKPRGKIIIPTKTTIIKMFAFDHCRELTAVDFRGCSKLKEIGFNVFYDCEALETVNLTGCSELTKIFLGRTAITGIDLSPCPKLTEISFYGCTKLESVKLTGCSEITYVNLCSTAITSMDLSGYSKLTYIDLSSTAISSIDLSTCPKVKTIDFSSCGKLESVNLTGCSELTVVYLGCIPITSMDLSICPKLTKIDFAGCQKLESVDLTGCSEITHVDFSRCQKLESVDLTGCSKLKKIDTDTFFDCIEAIVTLGVDIKEVSREAFGSHKDDWCKRVCVPNDTIKRLVINSGYPEDRIEIY